jgi:hypothetical protein
LSEQPILPRPETLEIVLGDLGKLYMDGGSSIKNHNLFIKQLSFRHWFTKLVISFFRKFNLLFTLKFMNEDDDNIGFFFILDTYLNNFNK